MIWYIKNEFSTEICNEILCYCKEITKYLVLVWHCIQDVCCEWLTWISLKVLQVWSVECWVFRCRGSPFCWILDPENRGVLRRTCFCLKSSLIREINASLVPSSERSNAPAISCRSGFLFELSAPVNGWSGLDRRVGHVAVPSWLPAAFVEFRCPSAFGPLLLFPFLSQLLTASLRRMSSKHAPQQLTFVVCLPFHLVEFNLHHLDMPRESCWTSSSSWMMRLRSVLES